MLLIGGLLLVGCTTTMPGGTAPGAPLPPTDAPAAATDNSAALNLRQVLAMQLQLDLADVAITTVEAVTWPDQCLGKPNPAELCAAAETPGYRITLTANGEAYRYHTNADGSQVRLAGAPQPQIGAPIIEWTGNGDSGCTTAQISADGVAIGRCYEEERLGMPFPVATRATEVADFAQTFAPFQADTVAGTVVFTGTGSTTATPAEQRMIAEWARLVQIEAQGGRSGASWGLAFAWHREGGIAGFCDDLTVYVTGAAWATTCRGAQPQDLAHFRLDATQLETLYQWVDTFQPFEMEQSDGAVADGMTVTLIFSGAGAEVADEEEQATIVDFAQTLYTTAATNVAPATDTPATDTPATDTPATDTPATDTPATDTGEALVEAVEIQILESFPVQVRAVVRGQLPDACAFVESSNVVLVDQTFSISMTVARQPNMRCAQMLTPFEEIVPLDTANLAAGTYTVQAGEAVEEFALQQ